MTDLVKEMNLGTIKLAAKNVQARVEKLKTEGSDQKTAELETAAAGAKLMTPVVGLAIKNNVPGDEILDAIHSGSEEARQQNN